MLISETYKKRLQALAGIVLTEATNQEKEQAFAKSNERIPFSKDLMIQAIEEGREVGILFQSNNDSYKQPVSKYRIIYPVAIGLSKKGNAVIRAYQRMGQSESQARKTGVRSAEAEGVWRLMKVSNIKSMWFTENLFRGPLEAYNARDKSMINVEVAADFPAIIALQDKMLANDEKKKNKKNITPLFKGKQEIPVEPKRIIQVPGPIPIAPKEKLKPKAPLAKKVPIANTQKPVVKPTLKPTLTPTQKVIPTPIIKNKKI